MEYHHAMRINDLRVETRLMAAHWGMSVSDWTLELRKMGVKSGIEMVRLTKAEMSEL